MHKIQINLLACRTGLPKNRDLLDASPLFDGVRGIILAGAILLTTLLGATGVYSYYSSQQDDSYVSRTWNSFIKFTGLDTLNHFTEGFSKTLRGESDRINIVLVGIGGEGHEGPELADTIILASVQPKSKRVALFSLPRDLTVPMERYGIRKINNANAFGEQEQEGWGTEFMRLVLEKTFDIPIQYYIRIDFRGFEQLIDSIGGVTVTVENAFTDYKYPTLDKKYQTISFAAGEQIMDGATALKFARSRHSMMNNEGSDFARSKRQQKILLAIKEKITSSQVLLNPAKISEIMGILKDNITTNISSWEFARFLSLAKNLDYNSLKTVSFDDSPDGLLTSGVGVDGAYILQPRDGTFQEMRARINTVFADTPDEAALTHLSEQPVASIKNGTLIEGLATRTAQALQNAGFTIDFIGNAEDRSVEKTVLIDFTDGKKKESLRYLQTIFPTAVISFAEQEQRETLQGSDFLIVLGTDSNR
ncbi:LCP family protein [Candidatus Uhrbacteria bacterium]|nr:LCP family protein [Candidatus Uhrbacteria bacterium]